MLFSGSLSRPVLRGRTGFTLIELIVALAVVSVAATIFVKMHTMSLDLARTARNRTVAARLAEEQMAAILRNPAQFKWSAEGAKSGELFPVYPAQESAPAPVAVAGPTVMPSMERAVRRETSVYESFQWQATGRFVQDGAPYCEVSVQILWKEAGKDRSFVLTSAAALSAASLPGTQAAQPKKEIPS